MEPGEDPDLDMDYWSATKGPWKLDVRWCPGPSTYLCRVFHNGALEADVDVDYPHEVVEWIAKHFSALQNQEE